MTASDGRQESKGVFRQVGGIYAGVFRVYRAWWADILVLSLLIFVPLGLLGAADDHGIESIRSGEDFKLAALLVGALALSATALLGEVLLAGAIGLSLSHAEEGRPPRLRFIVGRLSYLRLIAVDLVFVAIIALGLVLLILPGLAAFGYLALAGPVVETEDRKFLDSFRRSFQLVRGNFWLVFLTLFPIELVGGSIEKGIERLCEFLIGHSFVAAGLSEALANVVLAPLFAIAVVLLTRKLILGEATALPGPALHELRAGKPSA